jgi:glycerophosphoryl diester phosphodiesterase
VPPRLYAHRGAAAELPENTLPAFERAIERGADALELDVHLTRDGHVVVAHDPDGARMCGTPRAIREATLAELERWDAGWGVVDAAGRRPFAGQGFRIPTLEAVLRGFPDRVINVDVKQWSPPMVEPLLALLRAHDAEPRVILASFKQRTLWAIRRAGYRGMTALSPLEVAALLAVPRAIWRRAPWRGGAAQIPTHQGALRFDTARMVARCHDLGLRVDYWTIDDPTVAARLLALGADGIMTNDPATVAPAFRAA